MEQLVPFVETGKAQLLGTTTWLGTIKFPLKSGLYQKYECVQANYTQILAF